MARPKLPLQFVLIETSWNVKNDITKVIEVMKEY